jgi:hypothetical protein
MRVCGSGDGGSNSEFRAKEYIVKTKYKQLTQCECWKLNTSQCLSDTNYRAIFIKKLFRVFLKSYLSIVSLCFVNFTFAQDNWYTQMSLSSDGKLIALGYVDKNKNEVIDIAKLVDMPNIKATRLSLGAVRPFTFAFGIDPLSLLITTRGGAKHDLLRVNVANLNSPKIDTLYSHPAWLRFPKEMDDQKVVFLEQITESHGASRWRVFDGIKSYNTIAQTFRLAAEPSVVGGNVFLPIPIKGMGIVDIVGTTSKAIREFYDTSDGFMVCADIPDSIACFKNDVTILMEESYGELVINKKGRICKIPGQWKDARTMAISRNGKYTVFQAIPRGSKERGLYLIETDDNNCRPQLANITREN